MSRLHRRDFLGLLLGVLAAGWVACREPEPESVAAPETPAPTRDPRDPEALAAALRERLDYLDLEEDSLRRYCRDYLRHVGPPSLESRDLYSRFLLSSDFFRNGADESRSVRYVSFYDPYLSPCPNPLARFEA